MKFILTLWISKFVANVVNLIDKKRGSNYSGKIALKLMPDFVKYFKNIDYDKVIFISGTNGKSTTTNMVYHVLTSSGKSVAANLEGANMMGGVATTLIKNSTLNGKFKKDILVLETDERSFPLIRKVLPGHHMGITNLQKDQVQRNGDPDFILRKFQSSIGKDMTLYLNNEEPRSQSLEDYAGNTLYFSVSSNSRSYSRDDFYYVTMPCPKCGHSIIYDKYNLSNIGTFHCSKCGYSSKESPEILINDIDYYHNTFKCTGKDWKVPYNNPFYIYNFAMCLSICRNFGLTDEQIQSAFSTFQNPATHSSSIRFHGKELHYLQGKQENPDALQSQIDVIAADPRKKAVFIGLYPVRDFYPYYSGSFYFFDCDLRGLTEGDVEKYVCFSSPVACDVANRLLLAGVPSDKIVVKDTNNLQDVFDNINSFKSEVIYVLTNTGTAKATNAYFKEGSADHV